MASQPLQGEDLATEPCAMAKDDQVFFSFFKIFFFYI